MDAEQFRRLGSADRYRASVLSVLSTRSFPVATGLSAAALFRLPMTGDWPDVVYLLAATSSGRRRNGVVEIPRRGHEEVIEFDGFLTTSIIDTLLTVCRTAPFLTAVTMVDAAARVDRYGDRPPVVSLDELRAEHARRLPFRGSRRVQRVLDFATTDADTSFETLSRVVIEELGFPKPILQYPIDLPRSRKDAFFDFGWPEYLVDGEADGWGKYVNPEYGPEITPEERVKLEKRRENEVRGLRWTPARWEWSDAWHSERLRAILLEAGLPIVRRPRNLRRDGAR
jgi:hypothetical protein